MPGPDKMRVPAIRDRRQGLDFVGMKAKKKKRKKRRIKRRKKREEEKKRRRKKKNQNSLFNFN